MAKRVGSPDKPTSLGHSLGAQSRFVEKSFAKSY
jgi:hypothetical protein